MNQPMQNFYKIWLMHQFWNHKPLLIMQNKNYILVSIYLHLLTINIQLPILQKALKTKPSNVERNGSFYL